MRYRALPCVTVRYPALSRAIPRGFRGRGQAGVGGSKVPEFRLIFMSCLTMHPQGVRRIVDAARDRRTPLMLASEARQLLRELLSTRRKEDAELGEVVVTLRQHT